MEQHLKFLFETPMSQINKPTTKDKTDKPLTESEQKVYDTLVSFSNHKTIAILISSNTLSRHSGVSRSSVIRALNKLIQNGEIYVYNTQYGNIYSFIELQVTNAVTNVIWE